MKVLLPFKALDGLEHAEFLDGVVAVLQKMARQVIRPGPVKDVLHGVPTGHPFHPVAVQLPIGAWTSAVLLDFVPGAGKASRVLIVVGLLSAGPAVASGVADWAELHPQQQRVGVVHSAANSVGALLFGTSLALRYSGHHRAGRIVSVAALATIALGGTLGGQLAYRQAAGANHAEAVPHLLTPEWYRLGASEDFVAGKLEKRMVGEVPVVIWCAEDGTVSVLSNECSHLSGPLNEGTVIDISGDPCVECPWHHSRFSLTTGEVRGGPATSPQAVFKTRIVDGVMEVSLPHAG